MTVTTNPAFHELAKQLGSAVQVNPINTEFSTLKQALLYALFQNYNISNVSSADTVDFIMDAIATFGANAHFGADRAWEEGNIQTARLDSSIRAITRSQGVRMTRKTPAKCAVFLQRQDAPPYSATVTIPAYTQFTCNGFFLFNREAIVFNSGQAERNVTLYQGQCFSRTFPNTGADFAKIIIGNAGFVTSDLDTKVIINNADMAITQKPIWHFKNIFNMDTGTITYRYNVVEDFTISTGELEVRFGSDSFGYKPVPSDVVQVKWVETKGAKAHQDLVLNQPVSLTITPPVGITGTCNSIFSEGQNEVPAETYKRVGPLLFAGRGSAVDDAGYKAASLDFPGVIDAVCQKQAVFAAQDKRYIEYVKVSLLTNVPLDNTFWNAYVAYMQNTGLFSSLYLRDDPHAKVRDVIMDIFCLPTANRETIQAKALAAIQALFASRYGILGLEITRSDIEEAVLNCDASVNFVELKVPASTLITNYPAPDGEDAILSQTGGALAAGQYQYYISTVTSEGETLANLISTVSGTALVVNTNTGKITLEFSFKAQDADINVYRAGPNLNTIEKIASLSPETLTPFRTDPDNGTPIYRLVDGGIVGVATPLPNRDTSSIFYNTLGQVILNAYPTDRIVLNSKRTN